MSQTVNWPITMYSTVNSQGPSLVPKYKHSPYLALFFVLFIILGGFFITNLFVGVVISTLSDEMSQQGKHFLLTEEQKMWMNTKIRALNAEPKLAMIRPKLNRLR